MLFKKRREKIKNFFIEFWACAKNSIYLICTNWKPVLAFAILNVFASVYAITFFVDLCMRILYTINGVTYLGQDNIKQLFLSPAALIIILAFFLCSAVIAIFEIAALLHAFSLSQIGKKASFLGMISYGIRICNKVIKPKNWLIIPAILIILPLTGIINLTNNTIMIVVPGFILDFLLDNNVYAVLTTVIYIILAMTVLFYIHALNFFCIGNNDSFYTCCKKSRSLMNKQVWHTIWMLMWFSILFTLIITATSSTFASIALKVRTFFNFSKDLRGTLTQNALLAKLLAGAEKFVTGLVLPILNLAALSTLFYKKMDEQERLNELSEADFIDEKPTRRALTVFIIISSVIVAYNIYNLKRQSVAYSEEPVVPAIIAHRGDSVNAPENSMPAFKAAIYENADGIELDVHETKDGVIIVCHDENLERISGKNINVYDVTYDEIKDLDVGSYCSEDYKGLKISTLDEVLQVVKNSNLSVQIEIKPTPYDFELEEKVLDIINKNEMHDRVTILSLKTEPLKRVKELDPTISTTYCMVIAWDDIQDISFADHFSVEENNITPMLVHTVHEAGKTICAWTINSEDNVQYLVYCNVDGILTDSPLMMKNALEMVDYDGGLRKLFYIAVNRVLNGY